MKTKLKQCFVFRDWSRERLDRLGAAVQERSYFKGTVLTFEGETSDRFMYIVSGTLAFSVALTGKLDKAEKYPRLVKDSFGVSRIEENEDEAFHYDRVQPVQLTTIGPGEFFGESAILAHHDQKPAIELCSAVVTSRRIHVLELSAFDLFDESDLAALLKVQKHRDAWHKHRAHTLSNGCLNNNITLPINYNRTFFPSDHDRRQRVTTARSLRVSRTRRPFTSREY